MTLIQLKNNKMMPAFPSFIGNFFNDFLNDDFVNGNIVKSVPAVNISETANDFLVELAAPGLTKDDFKIEVENGTLSISGGKQQEKNENTGKFTRREFSYSSFQRSFTMPENVNGENISANYVNGVLTLVLPKKEEAKQKGAREIKVS
jgi:HSP20 family protein